MAVCEAATSLKTGEQPIGSTQRLSAMENWELHWSKDAHAGVSSIDPQSTMWSPRQAERSLTHLDEGLLRDQIILDR
jgi:hypothetical protein